MPRSRKKKKKHSDDDETDEAHRIRKLASAIAKGHVGKCHALVAGVCPAPSSSANPLNIRLSEKPSRRIVAGETVLHVAARLGDPEIVDLLLSRGADINASDAQGRTPLHKAGPSAVRLLLESAERHGQRIDMTACDEDGCTVDDAVHLAMREDEQAAESDEEGLSAMRQRTAAVHADDYEGLSAARPHGSEDAWKARLAEESYFEQSERGGGERFGPWGDDDGGDVEHGSQDDWFTEIAAAFAAREALRMRAAREQADATASQHQAERDRWQHRAHEAAAERQKQADEAFQRFAEAHRRAVELAQLEERADARARYVAAWVALAPRATTDDVLHSSELPWPSRAAADASTLLTPDEVALHVRPASFRTHRVSTRPCEPANPPAVKWMPQVLTTDMDAVARRRALQTELRRWHPDKFVGRWGGRLLDAEREAVLQRVKQVSQCLTELLSG